MLDAYLYALNVFKRGHTTKNEEIMSFAQAFKHIL